MASSPAAKQSPPEEPWQILRWRSRHPAYREQLAPGVALTMLKIPAGSFWMGAPEEEEGSQPFERPVHQVKVGQFLMGQTPITQAQWRAVAQWEPLEGKDPWPVELDPNPVAKLTRAKDFLGDQRPVVNVRLRDAKNFCDRLRVRTGKHYTLPSEAQWEYACRAGTTTPFHFGATLNTDLANYDGNYTYGDGKRGEYRKQTTDVDTFPANAWGLNDMHGNVWEWCAQHRYDNDGQPPVDGRTWQKKSFNNADGGVGATTMGKEEAWLLRGGSWYSLPGDCRSAYRYGLTPDNRNCYVGFRVCCLPQDLILYP